MPKYNLTTIGVVALIVVLGAGFLTNWSFNFSGNTIITPTDPDGTDNTNIPTIPDAQIRAAKAQWQIRDALTKVATASGDTAYVSIVKADANGYFNLLNPVEETEFDAAPDTSSGTYSTGDDLLIAVSSDNDPTGGYETYPRWFYIENLDHNVAIKALPLGNPASALTEYQSGTTYLYKVNGAACESTGETVTWLQGTTNYWIFGNNFDLYGRVAKDYMIQQVTNKGVVGVTLNDGASWEDTYGEINANFTFTGDTEDINIELIGEASDVAFGLPTLAVTANGQVKQYNAVLVFATNATGIDIQPLLDDGWKQASKPDITANLVFYYVINSVSDGCIPSIGNVINAHVNVINARVPVTISDSGLSASTAYNYNVWVLDWQYAPYVANGITTTSLPSANGFLSDLGCDSVIQPLALTVSSGSVATPQLFGTFTTNA